MNLAERCESLEEENRKLKDMLRGSDDARFPNKWRLSVGEKRVLRALVSSIDGFRSHEALLQAAALRDNVGIGIVAVLIHRIRQKLKPYGVEINCIWGQGYRIDQKSKDIVVGARRNEAVQ